MLKTALFDCAINEKCCSVDGGRGIRPLFLSPPWGSPHPREFAIQGKKTLMPGGQPGGGLGAAGIDWCINSIKDQGYIYIYLAFVKIVFWKSMHSSCMSY